jgi:hypothetical protein
MSERVLSRADRDLIKWFRQLDAMRICAQVVSGDTPASIPAFYKAKVSLILPSADDKASFSNCFSHASNLPIPDDAFSNATCFCDLLNAVYDDIGDRTLAVFKAVAVELGTSPGGDPREWVTSTVFPRGGSEDRLCEHLAADMSGVFPQKLADQTDIRNLLRRPATIVRVAVAFIVTPS